MAKARNGFGPAERMPPTALVTGASRGLGETLARFLAPQGYRLVITARGAEELERIASDLRRHTEVVVVAGDVCDAAHRAGLAAAVGERLDLLANNASALGPSPMPRLDSYDLDDLRAVFEANVFAPLALVQATLPALRSAGGRVLNISSDAAVGAYPGWGGYGASKAALELISRTLAAELADVSVVTVDPGDMRTRMHALAFPGEDISDRPLPDATLPFWAWLLERPAEAVNGRRFSAQADSWEEAA